MSNKQPRTLKTVELTCRVLHQVKERDGAGVTEIASELDISKGAAYNHLVTLRENNLVQKKEDEYCLSVRLLNWGMYVRNQHPLYQAGRSEVDDLADETEEYAHLMTEEFGWGIHLYNASGNQGLPDRFHEKKPQRPDHLHLTSTGKAILAEMPDERVEEIIQSRGLPERTEHTVTSSDDLFKELEKIREQGYATNESEDLRGYRAVGASILDPEGEVIGGISVSGPAQRLTDDFFYDELPSKVMERANVIEVILDSDEVFW